MYCVALLSSLVNLLLKRSAVATQNMKKGIYKKKNITSFPELPVNIPWLNTVHRVFNLLWNICDVMHVGLN